MNLRLYRPPTEDRDRAEPVGLRLRSRDWSAIFWPIFISIVTILAMAFCGRAFAADIEDLVKYGTPDQEWNVKGSGSYLVTFDRRTGTPRWVLEKLDRQQLIVKVNRDTEEFKADDSVPVEFRVLLDDYRRSGFDKGHLAPAAVHRTSQRDLDSTFLLTNAIPQPHPVNAGIWSAMESSIAEMAETSSVWIVSAPLWIAEDSGDLRVRTIGRQHVWVPTHVGKAVLLEGRRGVDRLRAWVIPNSVDAVAGRRWQDFEVRVDLFEIQSGLDVFSGLDDADEIRLEGVAP